LEREKEVEALLKDGSDCGPEGCVIPGTTTNNIKK
jgi:hypothetical protein